MRKFFGPTGSVNRLTIESQALKNNMLGDPTVRVVDVYVPARRDAQGLPLLVDPRRLHRKRLVPYELGWLPREPAGTARPADRGTAHATGCRRLPGLLHPARRQPVHQLGFHGRLGGLPVARDAAGNRAALRVWRCRASWRVRQELWRVRRHHARAAPLRHLGGRGLSFRRYGLRVVLSAPTCQRCCAPSPAPRTR